MQLLKASYKANIVTWPGYEHGVGDPSEAAYSIAPEVQLIIIEGLYLALNTKGWDQVSVLCDETWYLDVSINTAMNRIIPRHMSSWGMTLEEAARKVAANDRLNAELVFTTRDQADWLIKPLEILL